MSEKRVVCGSHGETRVTFACRHVATGIACGLHHATEDPSDRWPDAWCDACEEMSDGGNWTDATSARAELQVLCTHCHEAACERNRHVPASARGRRARLTADERAGFVNVAHTQLKRVQAEAEARTQFLHYARWNFDDERSTLTFSDPARPTLVSDVRLVGSYSTRSQSFQWSWATCSKGAPIVEGVSALPVFGEIRGLDRLTQATWECDEVDGWQMTEIAALLVGADAIYRAPFDHLYWFMLLRNLRVAGT